MKKRILSLMLAVTLFIQFGNMDVRASELSANATTAVSSNKTKATGIVKEENASNQSVAENTIQSDDASSGEATQEETLKEKNANTNSSSIKVSNEQASSDISGSAVSASAETERFLNDITISGNSSAGESTVRFSDISVSFKGWKAIVNPFTITYPDDHRCVDSVSVIEYDMNGVKLESDKIQGTDDMENHQWKEEFSYPVDIYSETSYVRIRVHFKASDGSSSFPPDAVSDKLVRDSLMPVYSLYKQVVQEAEQDVTVTSDMSDMNPYSACLEYGTTEDESSWNKVNETSVNETDSKNNRQTWRFTSTDFDENKTYYGKIILKAYKYNDDDSKITTIFQQEIKLQPFQIAANKEYVLSEIIPDSRLQDIVLEHIGESFDDRQKIKNGTKKILQSQLDSISSLDNNRSGSESDFHEVSSLKGISYLKNLSSCSFENNGIKEISDDTFNGMIKLTRINLRGNDLTVIPNVSQTGITSSNDLNIHENKIPVSEFTYTNVKGRMPAGVGDLSAFMNQKDTQRVSDPSVFIPSKLYVNGNGEGQISPLFFRVDGIRSELDDVVASVNGKACSLSVIYDGCVRWFYIKDTDVAAGQSGTVHVKVTEGNTVILDKSYTAKWVTDAPELDKSTYAISSENRGDELYVEAYYAGVKPVKAQIVDANGKVYGETSRISNSYDPGNDQRYKKNDNVIIYTSNYYSSKVDSIVFDWDFINVPVKEYSILMTLSDGTVQKYENVVKAVSTPVIKDIYSLANYGNYDCYNDYLYIAVDGSAIDPERLQFTGSKDGENYALSMEDWQVSHNGSIICKLKKVGWADNAAIDGMTISLAGKSGYEVTIGQDTCQISASGSVTVYDAVANSRTHKIDFKTQDLKDGTDAKVSYKANYNSTSYLATGT